jgi:soluble lytic murein transglycosylase-like protein
MKKLTVAAAALAAGMLTIVAQSQAESDRDMFRTIQKVPDTRQKKAEKPEAQDATGKAGKHLAKLAKASSKKVKRSKINRARPGVDAGTTASIARVRPELIATARKSVKGDGDGFNAGNVGSVAGNAGGYTTLVSRYATSYGVPVSLAHAVIGIESNYRPDMRGRAGEVGLMQIKPATARMMGYTGSASGLFNPETNIKYGMKYLGLAHQLSGGTTCGTILRYNAGHGARRMNPVSAAYCSKVKRQLAGG